MPDDRRIRFAKWKLVGMAQMWWFGVEGEINRLEQPLVKTWQEMKSILQEKYLLARSSCQLPKQIANLQQGRKSVEYVEKFDDLMVHSRAVDNSYQLTARFKAGLRDYIRQEQDQHPIFSLEDAFEFATERYLKLSGVWKLKSQKEEVTFKKL